MAKEENQQLKEKCRVVTPEFVVSYPHVFKAAQVNGKGDPKFSITMLFKKSADLTVIKQAIKNAKVLEFGPNKENWPEDLESPVSDGDNVKYAKKEGYKGHWVIKAISNEAQKPGVVDQDVKPILNASDFYPGCYARAQVFARVWEFSGKQGVHFILDHVQKTKDGKSLSSRKAASEIFSPIDSVEDEDLGDDDDDDEEGFK